MRPLPPLSLPIEIAGQSLWLCPERAAFDPASGALFVADAHFGKAATFRAGGIPVPGGTSIDNLARLDRLIERHRPAALIFLGDFLHARQAQAPGTRRPLHEWRERHPRLDLLLVAGNHDRHAGAPHAALAIEAVEEGYRLGPWALCHFPGPVAGAYALAGHEHPSYRLRSGRHTVRLPCFKFGPNHGVLPAFGAFTGAFSAPVENERVFVVTDERVFEVPRPQAEQSARS